MPPNYPPSDSTGAVGAESHDSTAAPSSLCNIIVGSVSLKTLSDSPSSSRPLFSSSLLHLFKQVNIHNADNQHDDEHNLKVPGGTLTTFDDTCHPSCPSPCLFHHRFSHPLATRQSTRPPVCLRPPPALVPPSMQQAAPGIALPRCARCSRSWGGMGCFIIDRSRLLD